MPKQMKKRRSLPAAALAACAGSQAPDDPTPPDGRSMYVDFKNQNLGFIRSYEASPDAAHVNVYFAIKDAEGAPPYGAVLEPDGDGTMYVAVDMSSLLGERLSELRAIEADIGVLMYKDSDFYAVSGEVAALDPGGEAVATGVWSVYLAEKNPNVMRLQLPEPLPPGPYSMLLLSKTVDNAMAAGLKQSSLLIDSMRFFDPEGNLLPVNQDAGFDAPKGFGEPDRSNLAPTAGEKALEGARGSSNGWGQAVALLTEKNGGPLEADALLGSIVTVYYSSASPPELILQSWTDGKPDSAGWAKVAPARVNDSGNIAQYDFGDMVESFGTDDFGAYLDQLFVGDTGAELAVYSVTVAAAIGG